MCTDEQHREKMAALERINKSLETLINGRRVIDQTYMVSDTQGFILDYKDRKHLYIYSVNAIVIDLKSLGTLSVTAKTWTSFDYEEGFSVFTSGTTNPVSVLIRATDEVIA